MTDARTPGSDRPDHDRDADETTPREPAVAPEDRRDESDGAYDDRGASAPADAPAVDFGAPAFPATAPADASEAGAPVPSNDPFAAPVAADRDGGDVRDGSDRDVRDRDGDVRDGDRDGSDRDGETEVIEPVPADARDDDGTRDTRDADAPTAAVPPMVAPTAPPARAWSATSGDDNQRRTLHDDEALRAAEASRGDHGDASDRDRTVGDDRTDRTDRDGDAPTVVAPIASDPTRASSAAEHGSRSRDDAPTVAGPTQGSASYPAQPGTGSYPLVADGGINHVAVRRDLLTQQKEEFSGIRFGAGLLGWFAATGFGFVIMAIYGGIVGAWVAASADGSSNAFTGMQRFATDNGDVLSIVTAVVVLAVVFFGYLIGGFTASRVARFSGFKQGLATWLWGVVVGLILAVVAYVSLGADFSSLGGATAADGATDASAMSIESIVFIGLVVVLSFVGAVLGGLLGQRWHRKVDRFIPSDQV